MELLHKARYWALGISIALFAGSARADVGVPMLFVTFPAMVLALIPVVLVESFALGRLLKRNIASQLASAVTANIVSTILGIPMTWIALVFLQWATGGSTAHGLTGPLHMFLAVTWQAPWLIPYEDQLYWMIPAASLFLLVPFFFVSYFIEAPIVARFQQQIPTGQVRAAVFRANIASYACLAAFNIAWLIWALAHGPAVQR